MALAGIETALGGSKLIMWAVGVAATVAVGFGAAEVYEHKVPWGLAHQRDRIRDSIPGLTARAARDGAAGQTAVDKPAFDEWRAALDKCTGGERQSAALVAGQYDAASHQADISRTAAYRLGQASCGVKNATPPTSGQPSGGASPAGPGSVPDTGDDLAAILLGSAYAPRTTSGGSAGGAPVPGGGAVPPHGH